MELNFDSNDFSRRGTCQVPRHRRRAGGRPVTLETAIFLACGYWLLCIAAICLCKKILP